MEHTSRHVLFRAPSGWRDIFKWTQAIIKRRRLADVDYNLNEHVWDDEDAPPAPPGLIQRPVISAFFSPTGGSPEGSHSRGNSQSQDQGQGGQGSNLRHSTPLGDLDDLERRAHSVSLGSEDLFLDPRLRGRHSDSDNANTDMYGGLDEAHLIITEDGLELMSRAWRAESPTPVRRRHHQSR